MIDPPLPFWGFLTMLEGYIMQVGGAYPPGKFYEEVP